MGGTTTTSVCAIYICRQSIQRSRGRQSNRVERDSTNESENCVERDKDLARGRKEAETDAMMGSSAKVQWCK